MADELILTIFRKLCINNEKERK
ncbi:TPA: hypothetical protein ACR53A_000037 [Staphylococcus argenteus]